MALAARDRLLNLTEVTTLLGLSINTVRRMIEAGELPVVRPTGPGAKRAIRVPLSVVHKLMRPRELTRSA